MISMFALINCGIFGISLNERKLFNKLLKIFIVFNIYQKSNIKENELKE